MPLNTDGRSLALDGGLLTNANVYLALHTAAPTEAAPVEASGTGYARQEIEPTEWTISNVGIGTNNIDIDFGVAGAPWGSITHFALWDAATGGNLLAQDSLDAAVDVQTGSNVTFASGAITVTFAVAS